MALRTPLAWKNLTSSRGKFLLSSAGVGFAVLLMFMQIGFRNALFDSNVELIQLFDSDLIAVSTARFNLSSERRISRNLLDRIGVTEGVADTCALRIERNTASVKVAGHKTRTIRVISLDPDPKFMHDDQLAEELRVAEQTQRVLVDRRSKSVYGFSVNDNEALQEQYVELNGKRIHIGGTFVLGTDFANDGTLLMTNRSLTKYFPWRSSSGDPLDLVDIGLIKLEPGVDARQMAAQLGAMSPSEMMVFTRKDFIAREIRFWSRNTPIGVIFGIGTLMGLIVGAIICYQIQFTDISENMPELATLKAMGYSNGYFWSLVLCQSLYLACVGFVPGLLITWALYDLLASASGLVMRLTLGRISLVWSLTLGMCLISGVLALRRLWRADPASLF